MGNGFIDTGSDETRTASLIARAMRLRHGPPRLSEWHHRALDRPPLKA
jgi:hypothetical protein